MRLAAIVGLTLALVLPGPLHARQRVAWYPAKDSGCYGLFLGQTQIGYLDSEGRYYPRLGPGHFGVECEPPIVRPGPKEWQKGKLLFGVEPKRVRPGRTEINGRECTTQEAIDAIAKGGIPNDSGLLRLTVVGTQQERKRVLSDLQADASLAPWKDRLVVQDYAPGEWPLACGFVAPGKPTIYIQDPAGHVLHRQDDYQGPADLAQALRKVDPKRDPQKDPDARKSPLAFDPRRLPVAAWVLAGAVPLLFLLPRKKKEP